jgi:hypothetical protein
MEGSRHPANAAKICGWVPASAQWTPAPDHQLVSPACQDSKWNWIE